MAWNLLSILICASVEVTGQFVGVVSLLLPRGSQRLKFHGEAWWQVHISAESSYQPMHSFKKNSFIIISTSMTEESAWCSASSSLFQAAVCWPPIDFLSQRSYCCRILCSWSHYETCFASLEVWATQFWHSSFCGVWFLHPFTGLIFGGRLLGYKVRLCLM